MTLDGGEDDPLLLFQHHHPNRTMLTYQGPGQRRNSGGSSHPRQSKTPSAHSRRSRPVSKSPISLRLRDDSRTENLQLIQQKQIVDVYSGKHGGYVTQRASSRSRQNS